MAGLINGAGITNVAQLIRGNKYRLIYQANGGEDLGVYTFTRIDTSLKDQRLIYIFEQELPNGEILQQLLPAEQVTKTYEVEIVKSGGRRRNRRAAKKTRRNLRRSSRTRKA